MSTNEADILFNGGLDWFLSSNNKRGSLHLTFEDHQSVKHLVKSLGVPHVEIGMVRVNGQETGLDYLPQNGDRVEVFPAVPGCPVEPRFMLDNHLGRLTAHLRMLGFDCLYHNDFEDGEMARMLETDERILLTRDRQLLMRKAVQYGYCLRSVHPREQLVEVVNRFLLGQRVQPFTRCLRCNGLLEGVEKVDVVDQLEPRTKLYYEVFSRCRACGQIYWQGSHWEQMQEFIQTLK